MSQFGFLEGEFSEPYRLAKQAESYAIADPSASCLYARKALEIIIKWVFRHDATLPAPYQHNPTLNNYLNVAKFADIRNGSIRSWAKEIQRSGNRAAHEAKPRSPQEAITATQRLFGIAYWLVSTYSRKHKPPAGLKFNPRALPNPKREAARTLAERKELEAELEKETAETEAANERVAKLTSTNEELQAELAALRIEVAQARRLSEAKPFSDEILNESDTRTLLIDLYLNEAGWPLANKQDREYAVTMPPGASTKTGAVDYVLWGDDGQPLAVVEAKAATVDARSAFQQGALYASALETQFGRRPIIFTTNGYEHYICDDHPTAGYPPRRIDGFYTKDELELLIGRRKSAKKLAELDIAKHIAGRPYQERAIRSIAEAFSTKTRKGLLAMATGSGKTRTVIALTDLLMRANWVKRVLFLADRTELIRQGAQAFRSHLPDINPINLTETANEDGRLYVSTYQTMINKIDETKSDGTKRFGAGHFDLVIIDEAHRSVYSKYRAIFEYFDSLLVGLTATPKDEVHRDTYNLFGLETGFPTDAYPLEEAIDDGYLVPPRGIKVGLKYLERGIKFDELTEDEQLHLEEAGWGDDNGDGILDVDEMPDVSPGEINKWLFNKDSVDKVLEHLMTHGLRVAGGDRLGKTIVFAKNQTHAHFIKERFDAQYPNLAAGNFAEVITHDSHSPQHSIDQFKQVDKNPHIAISVDMLDTGVDVPAVLNLVLFKPVYSKTKFWQMIGRGTRLCEDLFGPGQDKTEFYVFDVCANLEYFSQDLAGVETQPGLPISARLFANRVELITAIDRIVAEQTPWTGQAHNFGFANRNESDKARQQLVETLAERVTSMYRGNFLVRRHLRLVEKYSEREAWQNSTELAADTAELIGHVAPLPDQLDPEHEDSKRFDLLTLQTQLALVTAADYQPQRKRLTAICSVLEGLDRIPAVAAQMPLIIDAQSDDWWTGVTYTQLERLRRNLRELVQLIERDKRRVVTTDLEDQFGEISEITFVGETPFADFKARTQQWLRDHHGEDVIAKVRSGEPLTVEDEAELQRLLVAADVGGTESFAQAAQRAGSLPLFIRSLTGLDRVACQKKFAEFLDEKRFGALQIRFVQTLIEELTHNGIVEPRRLYAQPFSGIANQGPESIFSEEQVDRLFETLEELG